MPDLMPAAMENLMPKMLPLIIPHFMPRMAAYLRGEPLNGKFWSETPEPGVRTDT